MSPIAYLNFIAQARGFAREAAAPLVRRAVEMVELQGVLHQPIDTLSKGFKRRVGLAQAMLHDPEVLILDEPTDGLDPNQKRQVRSLIRDISPDKAIVISTHILEEVEAVCTRAAIIAAGHVVFDGSPAELRRRSAHHNAVSIRLGADLVTEAKSQLEQMAEVAAGRGRRIRARRRDPRRGSPRRPGDRPRGRRTGPKRRLGGQRAVRRARRTRRRVLPPHRPALTRRETGNTSHGQHARYFPKGVPSLLLDAACVRVHRHLSLP